MSGTVEWLTKSFVTVAILHSQILEEVAFTADQVHLLRSGRPLIVDDGETCYWFTRIAALAKAGWRVGGAAHATFSCVSQNALECAPG